MPRAEQAELQSDPKALRTQGDGGVEGGGDGGDGGDGGGGGEAGGREGGGGDGGEEGGDGGEGGCAAQHTFQPGLVTEPSETHVMVPSDGTTPAGPEVPQYFSPLTVR